jgi:hypothetical protein
MMIMVADCPDLMHLHLQCLAQSDAVNAFGLWLELYWQERTDVRYVTECKTRQERVCYVREFQVLLGSVPHCDCLYRLTTSSLIAF